MKTPKIGGTLITHNCIEYDYCFREALGSLLPVCDEVVVVDAESTDGTFEALTAIATQHPHLRIARTEWKPYRGGGWLADITNMARALLSTLYHVSLQADEVIHDADYEKIRQCAREGVSAIIERLNFWYDNKHLIVPGTCCGHRILRCAPQSAPSVGDAESLNGDHAPIQQTDIRFFHYGLIREPKSFARKARAFQTAFTGGYDPIFDEVEVRGRDSFIDPKHCTATPIEKLPLYNGDHPQIAHPWLIDRGFIP